jgi:hypothetical protein
VDQMRRILLFAWLLLLCAGTCLAQDDDDIAYMHQKKRTRIASSGHSVTANFGGMSENIATGDPGNQLFLNAQQITPPANSTVSGCGLGFSASDTSEVGCAVYTDSAGAPNSKVCAAAAASSSAGWNQLVLSGCGTLTAGTPIWVAFITASATQNPMIQNHDVCPNGTTPVSSNSALGSFTGVGSFPSTFPANSAAHSYNTCFEAYVTLTYTSTNTYDINSVSNQGLDTAANPFTTTIPTFGSGHTMVVDVTSGVGAGMATAVTDAINGTLTDTLTQFGSCSSNSGGLSHCVFYICRATAGVNSVTATATNTGTNKPIISVLELQGTQSSSCADQSANNTSYITTASFTGTTTSTTTSATEFLYGPVANFTSAAPADPQALTPGGSWNIAYYSIGNGNSVSTIAILYQTVTSTGTYHVNGTYAAGNFNILPWIGTFH